MKMTRILVLLAIAVISSSAKAFDWKKCSEQRLGDFGPLGIFSSTTSFVSSFGDCSMLGKEIKDQQKLFFVQNYESLQKDIARGSGEYIETLTHLFAVSSINTKEFKKELQLNYQQIYSNSVTDVEDVYNKISEIALKVSGKG